MIGEAVLVLVLAELSTPALGLRLATHHRCVSMGDWCSLGEKAYLAARVG